MPDITMCLDDACPVRHRCRRHLASGTVPSTERQSYAAFVHTGPAGCRNFWPWPDK